MSNDDEIDLSDRNRNGIPDIFENRPSIVEILHDDDERTMVSTARPKGGLQQRAQVQPVTAVTVTPPCWPDEVQEWRQGDEFDSNVGHGLYTAQLIAVANDGEFAYCWDSCSRRQKVKMPIKDLVGHNESYRSRKIDEEMESR